jgi:hypothetical protein
VVEKSTQPTLVLLNVNEVQLENWLHVFRHVVKLYTPSETAAGVEVGVGATSAVAPSNAWLQFATINSLQAANAPEIARRNIAARIIYTTKTKFKVGTKS